MVAKELLEPGTETTAKKNTWGKEKNTNHFGRDRPLIAKQEKLHCVGIECNCPKLARIQYAKIVQNSPKLSKI